MFFFFKNIQVSHILLCSWFWSTLLWFFTPLSCTCLLSLSLCDHKQPFYLLLFSMILLLVYMDVCECVCAYVCVVLKKCIQCPEFKNDAAIFVIHLCNTCTCMCTKTSKICKIHTTKMWKIVYLNWCVVWKGWV